jgi:uncharacterized membrane protein YoaK (UPF0700 family)
MTRRVNDEALRDALLIALTVAMGSLDAISWIGLDRVYSVFQTGNMVILGLGLGGASGPPVLRAGVSLAAFGLGALIASRIVLRRPPRKLWPRQVTWVLISVTGVLVVYLALWLAVDGRPSSTTADWLIALGALAAGLQTGAMLRLGVRAVFTTAATATWTALMSDIATDLAHQRARDIARLAMVVIGLVLGVAAGAALMVHARDAAPVLAPALTALVAVTAAARFEPLSRSAVARYVPPAGPAVGPRPADTAIGPWIDGLHARGAEAE